VSTRYYKNLNQTLQTSNNSIIPISHYSSPWNIHISWGMHKRQNSCSIQQNQIKIIFTLPFLSPLHNLTHHIFDFSTIQYAIHLQRCSMKIQHEKQQHNTILISSNTNQTCHLTPPPQHETFRSLLPHHSMNSLHCCIQSKSDNSS